MMLKIVIFIEINVTGCDGFVDVAHGSGEPRTPVSLSLVTPHVCFIFMSLCVASTCFTFFLYI